MIRINLLSDREAIRKETSRQQISIYLLMILLVFVLLGWVQWTQGQKKSTLKSKLAEAEQIVKNNKLKVGEVEKFKKDKADLQEKLGIIQKLQKGKKLASQLIVNVQALIPEKMWLESIDFQGNSLAVDGYSIDDETIAKFMKDLERSKSFSGVDLNMTEQKSVEGVNIRHFSLRTVFSPPAENNPEEAKSKGP